MEPLIEFLNLICDTAREYCDLDYELSILELSYEGGLYAECKEGSIDTTYFNKSAIRTIPVLFQCCCPEVERGMEQLDSIANYMQELKVYPQGETFSWLDTTIAKTPNKVGKNENGLYIFSCILNCKIYY